MLASDPDSTEMSAVGAVEPMNHVAPVDVANVPDEVDGPSGIPNDSTFYVPSAVPDDPEAAPAPRRSRLFRNQVMAACLLVEAIVVGGMGLVVSRHWNPTTLAPLPERATLGLYETIVAFVGHDKVSSPSSPYRRALDWVQSVDPMALLPTDPRLVQRYILAYLYFATTTEQPWRGGCNAPVDVTDEDDCTIAVDTSYGDEMDAMGYRWLGAQHECGWVGITCDEMNQTRTIELGGVNLTGSFPEGILKLPWLQELHLSDNNLKGPLPSSLDEAKVLRSIYLTGNQLTGTIPDSWYRLHSIEVIEASDNQLTGSVSSKIGQLGNLRTLDLGTNMFNGTLPSELGRLSNAMFIILSKNTFHGTIPTTLGGLARVNSLHLHRNHLTGTIPNEIANCTELAGLQLHTNKLTGPIPSELYTLVQLDNLELSDNALTGTLSTEIGNLIHMFQLRMAHNKFTGTLPTQLGKLKFLEELSASGNALTGTVPERLCKLRATGEPGDSKSLHELQLDCATPTSHAGALPEISCSCCTLCCDPSGSNCNVVLD